MFKMGGSFVKNPLEGKSAVDLGVRSSAGNHGERPFYQA